jgi:hypothetical protein
MNPSPTCVTNRPSVFILVLLFFLVPFAGKGSFPAEAPYSVSGRVVDSATQEPLAFVSIVIEGTRQGGMTDIDGFFLLSSPQPIERLLLSYVGYYSQAIEPAPGEDNLLIAMQRQSIELPPVDIFPGENPAHRIIELAIENRDRNNPEKRSSFTYTSYNKFIFTGEFQQDEGAPPPTDTLSRRLDRYLQDNHFMIMETVNERRFRYPNRNNETIQASRISGFRNPVLAIMASQFQSFSFYGDYINISGMEYLSPLARGSIDRYFFLLEDTTFTDTDSVFIISYRPARGRNFDGIQGLLYINSNGWAIQNVTAEPYHSQGETRVRIQQQYERIDGVYWFPTQLLADVEFFGMPEPNNFKVVGLGRTYISDIRIDPPLSRRDFTPYEITFSPQSIVRDEAFWNKYRTDTLTTRDRNTYHRMDSIGLVRNLDATIDRIEALVSGYWRSGIFDIDISRLIRYNDVEGFRPGLGLRTNNWLSHRFSLHGYLGYGFRDQMYKYGWGGNLLLDRPTDLRLGIDYEHDRDEKGPARFLETNGLLSPSNIRSFFIQNKDIMERQQVWLGWRMLRNNLSVQLFAEREIRDIEENYIFQPNTSQSIGFTRDFRTLESGIRLRLARDERYLMTPHRTVAYRTSHPLLYLNLTKGWDSGNLGDFDYWKAEFKLVHRPRIRLVGYQQWVLQGGLLGGDTPWHVLFNAPASYRRFAVTVPQSFATMRMDEFFSDSYLALFFYHNFESLLFRRPGFSPQLVLLTNAGIGTLSNPGQHLNQSLQSFEKGYLESGVALLDLLGSGITSLGVEFMVRYGPYAFPQFKDNYSLRLSYSVLF